LGEEVRPLVAPPKNNIYAEFFGLGGMYSINYERLFTENVVMRLGATYLPPVRSTDFYHMAMLPLGFYYLLGGVQNKLELGFGGGYYVRYNSDKTAEGLDWKVRGAFFYSIGYRYQPSSAGFMFRIAAQLVGSGDSVQPWGGLALGYSF